MGRQAGNMVVQKRMSFLASLVWALAAIIMTVLIGATGIAVYALNMVDRRADDVVSVVEGLFERVDSLPPMLADTVDQRRLPAYRENLEVDVEFAAYREGLSRPVLTVRNNGDKTVGFLAMRLLVRDEDGRIVQERTSYVATPVAVDGCRELPGPILPGSERHISTGHYLKGSGGYQAAVEITDIFVGPWPEHHEDSALQTRLPLPQRLPELVVNQN